MAKRKAFFSLRTRRRAFDVGFEFLAVISGVLVAFWLNGNVQDRANQQEELFYLTELQENLAKDVVQLQAVIAGQGQFMATLDHLLEALAQEPQAPRPLLDSLYTATYGNPTFFPEVGAYKAMVSAGSLDLLRNKQLVTQLGELYDFYYPRTAYMGTVLDNAVDRMNWENRMVYSFQRKGFAPEADLKAPNLYATLEYRHLYIGVYLSQTQATLAQLMQLEAAIRQELEQRN